MRKLLSILILLSVLVSILAVPAHAEINNDLGYYYVLYNSQKVDASDLASIKQYSNQLGRSREVILKDTSTFTTAIQVYELLKKDAGMRKGTLKGIQIIGSSEDVPAFDIHYKIQTENGIDIDSTNFKSDFFYSTFKNDVAILKDDFSIYKAFKEKLNVSFIPEWTVSRLPLTKGEISKFIEKYNKYVDEVDKLEFVPLVNFSNPIFAEKIHTDDMAYFIRERLDKEFHIFNDSQYRLYGLKQGYYPVTTPVLGDCTKETLKAENEKGIIDLFINSHGDKNSMDQAVFETADKSSEKTVSLLTSKDINQTLSKNFYTLTTWNCLNAWNLGTDNILHEALANGQCVNAMGTTSIISNNGVDCYASLEDMKKNNFYFFQYAYFKTYAQGYTRSDSFLSAQKAYAQEILNNTGTTYSNTGNYQYNLHNLLTNHYLGLIEYNATGKTLVISIPKDQSKSGNESIVQTGTTIRNGIKISLNGDYKKPDFNINSLIAVKQGKDFVFYLDYESNIPRLFSYFDAPNAKIIYSELITISKGKNVINFSIPADTLKDITFFSMRFDIDEEATHRTPECWASFKPAQLFVHKKLYDIDVVMDGKTLEFDVPPISANGRTMVPLRTIFEALGAKVEWDGATKTITGTKDKTVIVLKLDSKTAKVNGKTVVLDAAPLSIKGRTLVPVRFISESLGANVEWDGKTKTVIITSQAE